MSSEPTQNPSPPRRWLTPMVARSPREEHRSATPLELFFDLVFVVAIAQAANWLHHELAEGHVADGLLRYGMVFFAIWWAWMNFTWFASAYDVDDVPYRILVLLQMAGALVLAAGVERALGELDFAIVAAGYVVMRVAAVAQWLRAAVGDPPRRPTALRYAGGITACQIAWLSWLFLPEGLRLTIFFVLAAAELLVPVWAERAAPTAWHREHIEERYGLFTIIVLGEAILAATSAVRQATIDAASLADLAPICAGGLLIVFSLWWLYFARPRRGLEGSLGRAFLWGYGHLLLFASAAAVGAGIAVRLDESTGHTEIGSFGSGAAVAFPVALFLLGLWILHVRPARDGALHSTIGPAFAILVAATAWTPAPVLATGLLTASLLTIKLATRAGVA